MEEEKAATEEFFSMLDNFGSEIGTTLSDLATDWEQDGENKAKEKRSGTISSKTENVPEEVGRRMAKPLSFYNPVYKMVHKNTIFQKIKRPTLIPISQLNGSSKPNENAGKTKKEAKGQKTKKGLKSGLMSKISAVTARRHSNHKIIHEEPVHHNQEKRQSVESHNSSEFSTSSNLPSPHRSVSSSPVKIKPLNDLPKPKKTPPVKSPRMSRLILSEDGDNALRAELTESAEKEIATQELETTSPQKSGSVADNDEADKAAFSFEPAEEQTVASPITNDGSNNRSTLGSETSLASISEDALPDADVKTMEDVMSEVPEKEPEQESKKEEPASQEPTGKGRLKRDRTLRWTGTRKAPVLMREFTRKNIIVESSEDLASSNEDINVVKGKEIEQNTGLDVPLQRSRSLTPSQLTTSFDMVEDHYASEEANYDGFASETSATTDSNSESENKVVKTDAGKTSSNRDSAFITLSSFLPPAPRLRRSPSSKIRAYLQKLGSNMNNALGYAVTQFVEENLKNKETRPLVLLHDVRSFLSDIKHYLLTNPGIGLKKKIEKIVSKPSVDIEGAVDDALDRLVLYPLHDTIYRCLVVSYKESGHLEVMREAMSLAKKKTTKELGIRKTLVPPDAEAMEIIKGHFIQLQRTYSPYFKLRELLGAVTKIYQSTKDLTAEDHSARKLGADDFLPLLVYAVVHCDFIAADIETQYMDGLLDPSLLLGEGGYYLTTLISAIQVVISIQRKEAALPNISDLQGFLKVGISSAESHSYKKAENTTPADEVVLHKTLHVPPAMTAHNLCHMISKKFNIASPEDYSLHVVVNDVAYALESNDCPQLVKMDLLTQYQSTSFFFSFQRRSIVNVQNNLTSSSEKTTEFEIDEDGKTENDEKVSTNVSSETEKSSDKSGKNDQNQNIQEVEESREKESKSLQESFNTDKSADNNHENQTKVEKEKEFDELKLSVEANQSSLVADNDQDNENDVTSGCKAASEGGNNDVEDFSNNSDVDLNTNASNTAENVASSDNNSVSNVCNTTDDTQRHLRDASDSADDTQNIAEGDIDPTFEASIGAEVASTAAHDVSNSVEESFESPQNVECDSSSNKTAISAECVVTSENETLNENSEGFKNQSVPDDQELNNADDVQKMLDTGNNSSDIDDAVSDTFDVETSEDKFASSIETNANEVDAHQSDENASSNVADEVSTAFDANNFASEPHDHVVSNESVEESSQSANCDPESAADNKIKSGIASDENGNIDSDRILADLSLEMNQLCDQLKTDYVEVVDTDDAAQRDPSENQEIHEGETIAPAAAPPKEDATTSEAILNETASQEELSSNDELFVSDCEEEQKPKLQEEKPVGSTPADIQILIEETDEELKNELNEPKKTESSLSPEKTSTTQSKIETNFNEKVKRRSVGGSPLRYSPNNRSPLRSRRAGSVSNDSTDLSYNSKSFKRISCMPRDSVASLKEFFEAKTSPVHQKSS